MKVRTDEGKWISIESTIKDKHIEQIYRQQKYDSLIGDGYEEYITRIRQYESTGPAFVSRTETDVAIALGGIIQITKGVGHLWMALSTEALRRPKGLFKACKYLFEELKETCDFHRIQADIDAGEWANIRFAEKYDFNYEGIMKAYGPDKEDFYRYAWRPGVPGNRKLTKLMKKQSQKKD